MTLHSVTMKKNYFNMALKIKVKELANGCMPIKHQVGDYYDLVTSEDVYIKRGGKYNIPLGIAVQLPNGFCAKIESRSSTYSIFKIRPVASFVIDNSYKGDNDEWHFIVIADEDVFIPKGTPICQFSLRFSQFATFWNKIKWLFSNGVKIERVYILGNKDRGGIGSTNSIKKES